MKFSTKFITAAVLMASSSVALAAVTASQDIIISVTKDAYVVFDAPFATTTISPTLNAAGTLGAPLQTHSAGTIGTTSNITGTCNISVTSFNAGTLNDFNLINAAGTELYPTPYAVNWLGQTFGSVANTTTAALACNSVGTPMNFVMPAISTQVAAGTYSDTVTITLATP